MSNSIIDEANKIISIEETIDQKLEKFKSQILLEIINSNKKNNEYMNSIYTYFILSIIFIFIAFYIHDFTSTKTISNIELSKALISTIDNRIKNKFKRTPTDDYIKESDSDIEIIKNDDSNSTPL